MTIDPTLAGADDAVLPGGDETLTPTLLPMVIIEKVLEQSEPVGVSALARALDVPRARIHRHVTNLRHAGFLAQDPVSRGYTAGWRMLLMSQRVGATSSLLSLARPVMTQLRRDVGQTVVLSQLTDHGVVVTEVLPGGSPIDVILSPGTRFGYNSAAQGKVALAFAGPDQLAVWRGVVDDRRTEATILAEDELWAQVDETRTRGWASAPEETYRGVNAVAAPVLGHDGHIVCTLAIIASIHYLPDPPATDVTEALTSCAAKLSTELGYSGDQSSAE